MAETVELKQVFSEAEFEKMFPVVEIEQISLRKEKFMEHKPVGERQIRVWRSLILAESNGMKNFRMPAFAPSFADDGKTIIYEKGRKLALGKSATWWKSALADFMPIKNSRMCTQAEYDVRLGTIIKYLVDEKGYEIEDAWYAVCDDSQALGYYWNSEDSCYSVKPTGTKFVGKWADLANVYKFIVNDVTADFMIAGGHYNGKSYHFPLARLAKVDSPDFEYYFSVGLLAMDV